jgi:perosamine synthetase
VNEPSLSGRELEYVSECVRTGWVSSTGHFVTEFEDGWAKYCGRKYGVAVSNGTVALQAAVACLELEPGDEVIIPSFTIISCVTAVLAAGAIPTLIDSDPTTWTMDVDQLASRITTQTRAIMPVHIYGHPVDMDAVSDLAEHHGLAVIEDSAEAHGAEYLAKRNTSEARWRRCGGFGTMSCFSFYANKLVTTGEGGMIVTDDLGVADRARSLRNLAFVSERRFSHDELGFNFRLTNLQAALGVAQLERMDEIVARKRAIADAYRARLAGLPGLTLQGEMPWARSVFWMYGIVVDEGTGLTASDLAERLNERGVETRPFFLGMHEQPVFHRMGLFRDERHPVAERLARQGLYLPSGLALTDAQIETVCSVVTEAIDD